MPGQSTLDSLFQWVLSLAALGMFLFAVKQFIFFLRRNKGVGSLNCHCAVEKRLPTPFLYSKFGQGYD